jgi:hypothetical protein
MLTPLPCPTCGTARDVHADDNDGWMWTVCCSGCYDADLVGDPPRYVSRSLSGSGLRLSHAIADWNEAVLDRVGDLDFDLGERGLANLVTTNY